MGLLRGFMAMRSSRDRVVNGTSRNYAMPFVLGECAYFLLTTVFSRFLNVKALVGAFNKEMA